jgi:pSer/pThr/pTyr-binding forkhead associated (FHA) protein
MSLTVIVRLTDREVRLTFDATQRVVVGRGASSDVRLPDASVSHRHATLRAQEGDFLLVDEGSANGTFVGGVRVAPHTSRIVRSGDRVRIGRITLELRMEQAPATRDVSLATRDLALALVARSMRPEDTAPRLRIVEGPDQGAVLALLESERIYVIGRGTHCDLPLADADASRDHAHAVRR